MKLMQSVFLGALIALGASGAKAEEAPAAVTERLAALFEDHKVQSLQKAPVDGFYEAIIGSDVFYVSADGNYLMHGNLYDVQNGLVNLTDARRDGLRKEAMASVGEDRMIIFGPSDAEHTITVFTDIDCGYCRKLHGEIEKYNEAGIRVRYLFYPRSGPDTPSFAKATSVWCADDRQQAMTAAKAGEEVEPRECENPVLAHFQLGQEVGVTGTPALVLENGQLVPGYIPAERLKLMLDAAAAGS
jgi:thiol:disulfide interchange protein DsbC